MMTTFTNDGVPFLAVKISGLISEIEAIYAQVADVVNGDSKSGPKITVGKKDGSQVEVELVTIIDEKIDGDNAEVIFGFSDI